MKEKPMKKMSVLAKSTGNPILDFILTILLPLIASPAVLAVVFNVILQTVKNTQSKAVARQIELTVFQTIGTMNAGDPAFNWPTPVAVKRRSA